MKPKACLEYKFESGMVAHLFILSRVEAEAGRTL